MNNLLEIELLNLLNEDRSVSNHEMKLAYGNFLTQVKAIIQSEVDFSKIFRILNLTRIEFRILQEQILYGEGKSVLKNVYLQKAVWYLEAEIELTKLIFSQSERAPIQNSYNSKVYFTPNSKGLGIDSRGFALTLDLSKQFIDEEGKPVPFIRIENDRLKISSFCRFSFTWLCFFSGSLLRCKLLGLSL